MRRSAPADSSLATTARQLAVRMSYEDVIRVAEAQDRCGAAVRIAADMGVKSGETFTVTEFLKPGVEEFCSILPPALARPFLAWPSGFRRSAAPIGAWRSIPVGAGLSALSASPDCAGCGRRLPLSRGAARHRGVAGLIGQAAPASRGLAIEIAECARLIKGYGDTHKRGSANYRLIENELILPALAGDMPVERAADAARQCAHGGAARS